VLMVFFEGSGETQNSSYLLIVQAAIR
jgi:hypothetical protein